VVAVPLVDGVPVFVLPGVGVCCDDTAPSVDGNSRDGGKMSVLERLGVVGPLGLGVRAGAPLPTPPGDEFPGVVEVPDDVWASPTALSSSARTLRGLRFSWLLLADA